MCVCVGGGEQPATSLPHFCEFGRAQQSAALPQPDPEHTARGWSGRRLRVEGGLVLLVSRRPEAVPVVAEAPGDVCPLALQDRVGSLERTQGVL